MRRKKQQDKQLKKQPKLQRANKTGMFNGVVAPAASVTRRKRAKTWRKVEGPLKVVQNIVFSARWISLAMLGVAGYLLYGFINSPDYFITQIPIVGAESIPMAEIAETSGLAGRHIFAADPELAAESILEMPGITAADVRLSWPNKVDIVVVEEQPVAVWVSNGTTWWINRDGGLFPAREDRADLMMIDAAGTDGILGQAIPAVDLDETDPAFFSDEEVEEVETNYGSIPDEILHGAVQLSQLQPYGEPIMTFRFNDNSGLHFSDPRGWDAHWGTGVDMDQKLAVYNALVNELQAQGITPIYISVENPKRPIFRSY
ncbi:MAG: cell division protein FtsQ/DivIB [Anaerolineae bacterium]